MENKTVKVPTMSCGHCVATIEREVGDLGGVSAVQADLARGSVKISWDPDTTDWVVISDFMREIEYAPAD